MNIQHLATKGWSGDIAVKRSIVYNGVPIRVGVSHKEVSQQPLDATSSIHEELIEFNPALPDDINFIQSLDAGRNSIIESPIGGVVFSEGTILPLSSLFDFRVRANGILSEVLPVGATFDDIFETSDVQDYMRDVAITLFPHTNPNTQRLDILRSAFYTPYIPLVALTGCIPPQVQNEDAYFNPEGVVSVAEFLDGINSIKYGANANNYRKKTLDNISDETDYFNEGYQSCLVGLSSPFFNLYTREELLQPITRLELAYITVICWTRFMEKFNTLYGNNFYLGINFDWTTPFDILAGYEDGFNYKVSKISINTENEYDAISLNIKDYKADKSMTEYKKCLQEGSTALPLPMFMSMLELGVLDLFYYEGNQLNPMREVSRGEFAYFLTRLAKLFPTRYISNN